MERTSLRLTLCLHIIRITIHLVPNYSQSSFQRIMSHEIEIYDLQKWIYALARYFATQDGSHVVCGLRIPEYVINMIFLY